MTETRARQLRKRWLIITSVLVVAALIVACVHPGDWSWALYSLSVWSFCGIFKWNGYLQRADEKPNNLPTHYAAALAFMAWQKADASLHARVAGPYSDYQRARVAMDWIEIADRLDPHVTYTSKAYVRETAERWLTEEE